jgi:hypothetical protein
MLKISPNASLRAAASLKRLPDISSANSVTAKTAVEYTIMAEIKIKRTADISSSKREYNAYKPPGCLNTANTPIPVSIKPNGKMNVPRRDCRSNLAGPRCALRRRQ